MIFFRIKIFYNYKWHQNHVNLELQRRNRDRHQVLRSLDLDLVLAVPVVLKNILEKLLFFGNQKKHGQKKENRYIVGFQHQRVKEKEVNANITIHLRVNGLNRFQIFKVFYIISSKIIQNKHKYNK
jgi:hypothetical protein